MGPGPWGLVHGAWPMGHGQWGLAHWGAWPMGPGQGPGELAQEATNRRGTSQSEEGLVFVLGLLFGFRGLEGFRGGSWQRLPEACAPWSGANLGAPWRPVGTVPAAVVRTTV